MEDGKDIELRSEAVQEVMGYAVPVLIEVGYHGAVPRGAHACRWQLFLPLSGRDRGGDEADEP